MEVVKLHINFTLSVSYILCAYPPPKKKKSLTELELEKQLAS